MSYILDALRKAERDRNLGRTPTLESLPADVQPPSRGRGLLGAVVGAGLAILLAATGFWWTRTAQPTAPAMTAATNAVVPAPAAVRSPVAVPDEPSLESVTVNTPDGPVAAQIPPAPAIAPVTATQSAPVAPAVLPATTPVPSAVPAAESALPATEPSSAELPAGEPPVEAAVVEEPPATASPATDDIVLKRRARLDIPSYEGLPDGVRSGMPPLTMNAHVFSTTPGKGFVMVNGKKYREGDGLAEGPEVVEILAEGAVLRYRNTDFLLPVPR